MNFFGKIKNCFKKTQEKLISSIGSVFSSFQKVDENFLNKLEEVLVLSDISINTAIKIKDDLRSRIKSKRVNNSKEILEMLKLIMIDILKTEENKKDIVDGLLVILGIGINGAGKTTTLAKLGFKFKSEGKKVLFAAGDTFRAAAAEQLCHWANKIDCEIVQKSNSDPGAVIFEAIDKSKRENFDVLLCDTAGRLHNKENLMAELGKIDRIINKKIDSVKDSYRPFLIIDSNTGQNSVIQALEFSKIIKIAGVVVTKLDGSPKGGSIISIKDKLNLPIKYIGTGEKLEDLEEFDPKSFCDAIFSEVI